MPWLPSLAALAAACLVAAPVRADGRYLETPNGKPPRVVITADPELDDLNSLIRYVLHASDYRTEGLVYASSQYHWTGDGKGGTQEVPNRQYNRGSHRLCPCTRWRWDPDERFIDDVVDAYEQVYPNLRVHDARYPPPQELRAKIRWGNVAFEADMSKDTPGSDLIKGLLLDDLDEPIYLHAWGGLSTIGRALKSIEEQYAATPQWPAIRARVIAKAVIHPSGDQDGVGASYIKPRWPEIRYGLGGGASGDGFGYVAQLTAAPQDRAYYTAAWMRANVSAKGPLGGLYRVWGDGKQMVKDDIFDYFGLSGFTADELRAKGYDVWAPPQPKGEFLGEGDTGTFLSLLDDGLEGWRQKNRRDPSVIATAGGTDIAPFGLPPGGLTRRGPPPPRPSNPFFGPLMNDLSARLSWSVTPRRAEANHYPLVSLRVANITARAGEMVRLSARASDPDGDRVRLTWRRFDGYGTYAGDVPLDRAEGSQTSFRVPADAKPGDTIHVLLEATDDAGPPLTRYARAVVTVQ